MKIVATSDTHINVPIKDIPDGDVFIHAGDLCTTGYVDDWHSQLKWLKALPHKHKIFVPGNHDFHMQVYPGPALQEMREIGVLVLGFPGNDHFRATSIDGVMIGGCPHVGGLGNRWAFGERMYEYHGARPADDIEFLLRTCDVIVTHAPIRGILDFSQRNNKHAGDRTFRASLDHLLDRGESTVHTIIHGHIHEQYGYAKYRNVDIFNVAMADRIGYLKNKPIVIDL